MFQVMSNANCSNYGAILFNQPSESATNFAHQKIAEKCISVVDKKYQNWDIVYHRLDDALAYLKQSDSAFHMLIGLYAAELSKNKEYSMNVRHTVSIIDYLLGMTTINPLPPHYICPQCKHIESNSSVVDGFDLPQKHCPSCGTLMDHDGHNCSESICWTVNDNHKHRTYALELSRPVTENLQSYLDNDLRMFYDETELFYQILFFSSPLSKPKNDAKRKTPIIKYYNPVIWKSAFTNYIKSEASSLKNIKFDSPEEFLKSIQINSFSTAVRIAGLIKSHYTNKRIDMVYKPDIPIFRDEIHNTERENMPYLLPKSAIIKMLMTYYRHSWYKFYNYKNRNLH